MEKKQRLTGSFATVGLLILILDGKTALVGAQNGIDLCLRTVIPSLFPFFVLSLLLTSSLSGSSIPLLRPIGQFCGIPKGTEGILISGFLGGYPVGAQAIGNAYASRTLSREDSLRMLSFCSNAGPAFLFGMVSSLFPEKETSILLWFIHIGSALIVALLQPAISSSKVNSAPTQTLTLPAALHRSLSVMATVCGWVILFRIIMSFGDKWLLWLFPTSLQVLFTGFLELSNGCCELSRITNPDLRFVICSGMLAWGGVCVMLQTKSVSAGLPIGSYLKGKCMQCLLSLLISASVVLDVWLPVTVFLLLLAGIFQKGRKRSRNPVQLGV